MSLPLVAVRKKELGLCTFGEQTAVGFEMFVNVMFPVVVSRLQFFAFRGPEAKGALDPCLPSTRFWYWWILEYILLTRRYSA
jgi:hypothetical protein